MLGNGRIRHIAALQRKKERKAQGLYVAEGEKIVGDLARHQAAELIVGTETWWAKHAAWRETARAWEVASEQDMKKISALDTPPEVLGVFKMRAVRAAEAVDYEHEMVVMLDGVQDPGNMGTIVRIADWFGVKTIVAGVGTVDVYNPKVVQATMGALGTVEIIEDDLARVLDAIKGRAVVYGTALEGENIYDAEGVRDAGSVIVMGNEGKGLQAEVRKRADRLLLIPAFGAAHGSESLNVGVATGIVCSEFRRRGRR